MFSMKRVLERMVLLLAALSLVGAAAEDPGAGVSHAGGPTGPGAFTARSAAPASGKAAVDPHDAPALRKECEYGIALALAGKVALAESTFMSLLSHAPGDPRALTNLGNLSFLRGDPEVALAFYDQAVLGDSTDAGIRLNRAIAYLGLGQAERAQAEAAKGREMAGGSQAAQKLVGIRYTGDYPKGSELSPRVQMPGRARESGRKAMVSKEEIRALLGTGDDRASKTDRGVPAGRENVARGTGEAGTKASDEGNAATLLYWKR